MRSLQLFAAFFLCAEVMAAPKPSPQPSTTSNAPPPPNRVASIYISQDFLNEQLAAHSKSEMVKEMKVSLDEEHDQIFLRGKIIVPVEELRAVNLDPKLGEFKFQVTIKLSTTKHGHLILEFPLSETFFYPASSTDPTHERVIIPVQLLSLGLASVRGYLSALSGDFSGFDRRSAKLEALMKSLDRSVKLEKNVDALEELKNQREAMHLQLEAIPVERKQLEAGAKQLEKILGFTGEKELNLNNELGARKNALILKIKLSQLTPYLEGVDLGGIRILLDKKDGAGEKYFAVDIDSQLEIAPTPFTASSPSPPREGMKIAPSMIMRLNQSLFESEEVVDQEKKEMGSKIKNLDFQLKDDGLHVSGKYSILFIKIPFETSVDFVTTDVDVFEIRVRELHVAGLDLEFLVKSVLESMKKRLNHALKGMCKFKYVGEESDHSRALRVTVDPKALVPAFPDLHLVAVDVRDREFLLKIGHTALK